MSFLTGKSLVRRHTDKAYIKRHRDEQENKAELDKRWQQDLQQSFRYTLDVAGVPAALITNVKRPSYSLESEEYNLLNHKIYFPKGRVKWEPVTFTIKEVFSQDLMNSVLGSLMKKLQNSAYDHPYHINSFANLKDLSKYDLIQSLGSVKINMYTPEGEVYEEWLLREPFIESLTPAELTYGNDNILGITVKVRYDWAELKYNKK